MQQSSRRSFFKYFAGLTGAVLLVPTLITSIAQAEEKRRAKKADGAAAAGGGDIDLPLVKPGEGTAASLHYQHSHADVKDASFKIERNGVPFEKQFCSTCMLYTGVGKKGGDELGKCQLFNGQLVKSKGFCASWQKKT